MKKYSIGLWLLLTLVALYHYVTTGILLWIGTALIAGGYAFCQIIQYRRNARESEED